MVRPATRKTASQGSSGGGFLLGIFVGLVAGLAIALGVAFYLNKTPIPFSGKTKSAVSKEGADPAKPPVFAGLPQGGMAAPPAPPPVKPAEKPKFDFYKILPGGEEPVSERELRQAARATKAQPEAAKGVYYIQAGAFQNPADADNQKARLAILGFESNVETTILPDKGTWYRVRLGPFTRLDELNRVRQALAQNGIDASLVKLKDLAEKGN
ncbi:MAG: SPOR domain-containing protein [Burkholderiales bacterium]